MLNDVLNINKCAFAYGSSLVALRDMNSAIQNQPAAPATEKPGYFTWFRRKDNTAKINEDDHDIQEKPQRRVRFNEVPQINRFHQQDTPLAEEPVKSETMQERLNDFVNEHRMNAKRQNIKYDDSVKKLPDYEPLRNMWSYGRNVFYSYYDAYQFVRMRKYQMRQKERDLFHIDTELEYLPNHIVEGSFKFPSGGFKLGSPFPHGVRFSDSRLRWEAFIKHRDGTERIIGYFLVSRNAAWAHNLMLSEFNRRGMFGSEYQLDFNELDGFDLQQVDHAVVQKRVCRALSMIFETSAPCPSRNFIK